MVLVWVGGMLLNLVFLFVCQAKTAYSSFLFYSYQNRETNKLFKIENLQLDIMANALVILAPVNVPGQFRMIVLSIFFSQSSE